jgi:hypothetical protein
VDHQVPKESLVCRVYPDWRDPRETEDTKAMLVRKEMMDQEE